MKRHGLLLAALCVLALSPANSQQQSSAPLDLLRCAPGADAACFRTSLPLAPAEARAVGAVDSATESTAWAGLLAGERLGGPGVYAPGQITPPLRLLVLFDVSGSMIGEGIAFTRVALASFVARLDTGSVRVAVAPWESRGVAASIRNAPFLSPLDAASVIRRIPTPDPQGNTALYSALTEGLARVDAAVAESPGTQGAVLLVTDGRNDVGHERDDAGLLSGPAGLAEAQAAVARSQHQLWVMGVGSNLAADELRALAGERGSATIVALDPTLLGKRLSTIARQLRGERAFVLGLPGGLAGRLARSARTGSLTFTGTAASGVKRAVAWRPPLVALPAYEGTVPAGALPGELAEAAAAGQAGFSSRWLIALVLVGAGCLLWLVIPRFVWVTAAPAGPPARSKPREKPAAQPETVPATAATPPAGAGTPAKPGAVRSAVAEATPRRPDQVTAQSARRLKTQ